MQLQHALLEPTVSSRSSLQLCPGSEGRAVVPRADVAATQRDEEVPYASGRGTFSVLLSLLLCGSITPSCAVQPCFFASVTQSA